MPESIDVVAAYELPAPLKVSKGCFGKSFTVVIGGLIGKALSPRIAWRESGESPQVIAPPMDEGVTRYVAHYVVDAEEGWNRWNYWGRIDSWNPIKRVAINADICALVLRFRVDASKVTYSNYLHGRGHPQGQEINRLYEDVDRWFERVCAWTGAALDQDVSVRDPLNPLEIRGGGLSLFTSEDDVVSLPARASHITVTERHAEKIKLPTFRKIVAHANLGILPSDVHMLLKDGRAAWRRGQYRRAVIDAGSATEVALADFNRRTANIAIPKGRLPTLGWYVNQQVIASRAGVPANTKRDLVNIRNDAIHQNRVPTKMEAGNALAIAKDIVAHIDPLPF